MLNFISNQSKLELFLFSYTLTLTMLSIVVLLIKMFKETCFLHHRKLISMIYYITGLIFLAFSHIISESYASPMLYQAYIILLAFALDGLLVKGIYHLKIGDYEIDTPDSTIEELSQYAESTMNTYLLYPQAFKLLSDINELIQGNEETLSCETFVEMYRIIIESLLPQLKLLTNADIIRSDSQLENYLKYLCSNNNLWYNDIEINSIKKKLLEVEFYKYSDDIYLFLSKIDEQTNYLLCIQSKEQLNVAHLSLLFMVYKCLLRKSCN